jgi:hypothetical protein
MEIPFWWDSTIETLTATIAARRPDLVPNYQSAKVIPNEPNPDVLSKLDDFYY